MTIPLVTLPEIRLTMHLISAWQLEKIQGSPIKTGWRSTILTEDNQPLEPSLDLPADRLKQARQRMVAVHELMYESLDEPDVGHYRRRQVFQRGPDQVEVRVTAWRPNVNRSGRICSHVAMFRVGLRAEACVSISFRVSRRVRSELVRVSRQPCFSHFLQLYLGPGTLQLTHDPSNNVIIFKAHRNFFGNAGPLSLNTNTEEGQRNLQQIAEDLERILYGHHIEYTGLYCQDLLSDQVALESYPRYAKADEDQVYEGEETM